MNQLKNIFNKYVKIMKVITTFVGTFFIYFSGILLGKIIFLFVAKDKHHNWQKYQNGVASDKMF